MIGAEFLPPFAADLDTGQCPSGHEAVLLPAGVGCVICSECGKLLREEGLALELQRQRLKERELAAPSAIST